MSPNLPLPIAHVRAAILSDYPLLARALAVPAAALLGQAGVDASALADPDHRLPIQKVARLLDETVRVSGYRDIGLRLSRHMNIGRLGQLGLLACGRRTVAEAVQAIIGFSQLHNEALHIWVDTAGTQLVVREEYLAGPSVATEQLVQFSAGVITVTLRTLIADDWKPVRAHFRCAQPADISTWRQLFACPLVFNADFDGLVIDARDFARPNRLRDADPADHLQRVRERVAGGASATTLRLTTHLIWSLLPTGDCTAARVAQLLGYDRRTLHRHLGAHEQSFSGVVNAVRRELALRHVGLGRRRLGDIAGLLGFRSQSDFAHWFRREFAMPASRWRPNGAMP